MQPTTGTYRTGRGRWIARTVSALAPPLLLFAVLLSVGIGFLTGFGGLVEVRLLAWLCALVLGATAVSAGLAGLAQGRTRTTLGPYSIGADGGFADPVTIARPDIRGIAARRRYSGWSVRVDRWSGPPVELRAPLCGPWWPSRRFRRELAELQQYAPPNAVRPRLRPVPAALPALLGLVILGGPAVGWVATHGMGWPWEATVTATPDACRLLDSAGLDRQYPKRLRTRAERTSRSDWSRCVWEPTKVDRDSRVQQVKATLTRGDGTLLSSPTRSTRVGFRTLCRNGIRLDGIGDAACVRSGAGSTTAVARRANVLIAVKVSGSSADAVATALASGAIASLPLS
ncbi:hypothetical protein Athai_36480 [Actinocatenispora thailandica]|uniref:Uncharacterized protein n=2 Tax=Actinocatenispora thailandica TaxID=227318 RepID=A0A7R7DQQ6_9ACTN|nr:hypothetical protein Athai_36480 [Actinocatenispora thailandica]